MLIRQRLIAMGTGLLLCTAGCESIPQNTNSAQSNTVRPDAIPSKPVTIFCGMPRDKVFAQLREYGHEIHEMMRQIDYGEIALQPNFFVYSLDYSRPDNADRTLDLVFYGAPSRLQRIDCVEFHTIDPAQPLYKTNRIEKDCGNALAIHLEQDRVIPIFEE